jgi:hypothetical protein
MAQKGGICLVKGGAYVGAKYINVWEDFGQAAVMCEEKSKKAQSELMCEQYKVETTVK